MECQIPLRCGRQQIPSLVDAGFRVMRWTCWLRPLRKPREIARYAGERIVNDLFDCEALELDRPDIIQATPWGRVCVVESRVLCTRQLYSPTVAFRSVTRAPFRRGSSTEKLKENWCHVTERDTRAPNAHNSRC